MNAATDAFLVQTGNVTQFVSGMAILATPITTPGTSPLCEYGLLNCSSLNLVNLFVMFFCSQP